MTPPAEVRQPPKKQVEEPLAVRPLNRRSAQSSDSRLQRQLEAAERNIGKLEGRLSELSDAIAIASVDGNQDALARLGTEYADVQNELDSAYLLWEELQSQLESAAIAASVG